MNEIYTQNTKALLFDPQLCDIIVVVGCEETETQHFQCIRALLARHSPVFRAMLYGKMIESKRDTISLPSVEPSSFALYNLFVNGLRITPTSKELANLVQFCDCYCIKDLAVAAVDSFLSNKLQETTLHDIINLLNKLHDQHQTALVEKVLNSSSWENLGNDIVIEIINNDFKKILPHPDILSSILFKSNISFSVLFSQESIWQCLQTFCIQYVSSISKSSVDEQKSTSLDNHLLLIYQCSSRSERDSSDTHLNRT